MPDAADFGEEQTYESLTYCAALDADGSIVGRVYTAAAKGYGGTVGVMVGIGADGKITGIEILSHSETPGLGANSTKPAFKNRFVRQIPAGGSPSASTSDDGENVQAITAATITSKAVTKRSQCRHLPPYHALRRGCILMAEEEVAASKNLPRASSPKTRYSAWCSAPARRWRPPTSVQSAVGMGVAAAVVLVCSNVVISAAAQGHSRQGAHPRLCRHHRGLRHHRADAGQGISPVAR